MISDRVKLESPITLNIRPSCSTHSITSCWWPRTFRLFIIRTMDASIAYLLSLSTSSITFFFSSTGGRGIYIVYIKTSMNIKDWNKYQQYNSSWEEGANLNPSHFISEFGIELKMIIWSNRFVTWLFIENLIFCTWKRMKQSDYIIIRQV